MGLIEELMTTGALKGVLLVFKVSQERQWEGHQRVKMGFSRVVMDVPWSSVEFPSQEF